MTIAKKSVQRTVFILVAFAALMAGILVAQHRPDKKAALLTEFKGTLLENPRAIEPFSLMGIDEIPFTNQSLQGHWTLVFFGFTRCDSICPVTMAELGKMYRILQKEKGRHLPQVVMISVDPMRDTLPKLANYVKAFDPHFYAARGTDEAVQKMAKELGIVYMKIASKKDESTKQYNIQHSGTVILLNPQGKLAAFFTPPNQAEVLAKDYQLLVY